MGNPIEQTPGFGEKTLNASDDVDIVVTWVDDTDPAWRASRDSAMNSLADLRTVREGAADARFRDWGALRYWFRSIEENCSWVRKIYLVTVNPIPDWLVPNHPKLEVIHHREFIPEEFLPTFNSRVIELHLHRIVGLSEKFIYFNDDMYVTQPVGQFHFFPKGKPAGMAILNALSVGDNITHAMLNNIRIVNNFFDKRTVLRNHFSKWFTPIYGRGLFQNFALFPWKRFTGFHNAHLPQPLLRSTFEKVWNAAHDDLELTSRSQFRQFHDVNPFLMTYWQICEGHFVPVSPRSYGEYLQVDTDGIEHVADSIRSTKAPILCVNDGSVESYEEMADLFSQAFHSRFPKPSSFEK